MRELWLTIGVASVGVGVAMNLLLAQLRSAFFRAYLPPWIYASYGLIGAGVALGIFGLFGKGETEPEIATESVAQITGRISVLNALVAAFLVLPVLYPGYRFPILITQWPGIYMVIAYFSFIVVGVVGTALWSVFFHLSPTVFRIRNPKKAVFVLQTLLTQVGAYGLAISMFAGGYVGSSLAYSGAGPAVVGAQMEFSVIPSAVSIFLVVAGTAVGVLSFFWYGRAEGS